MTIPYRSPETHNYTVTLADVAAALASHPCASVLLQSDPANTVNVLFGDSGNQYMALTPGQSVVFQVENTNLIYAKRASAVATVLNYLILL